MLAQECFLWGIFGGTLAEVLGLYKLRHLTGDNIPDYLGSPYFWIFTALMIIAGGGLTIVYIKSNIWLNPLLAVNIGASAPLMISRLTAGAPRIQNGRIN